MSNLRVSLIFTPPFDKQLKKVNSTKDLFKKHLKRLLEGKKHKGEGLIPKKSLGKSLVLLKGKIMDGTINDRFVVVLYVTKTHVIPVFIAPKLSRKGNNVSKYSSECYDMAKVVLSYIQDGGSYVVDPFELGVDVIDLGNGIRIPS